ncbi:MAG: cell envelope integrity protein CreD [Bacteroidales bacterium]|nr:cell envelope integrity protein CreD [Bacteroidales bacterium]
MENSELKKQTMPEFNQNEKAKTFNSKLTIKIVLIGVIILLLLIPKTMISFMIDEREETANSAIQKVCEEWSKSQLIIGPTLKYGVVENRIINEDKEGKQIYKNIIVDYELLPENLEIEGDINCENLKRGIYDIITYNSKLDINGYFIFPQEEYVKLKNANQNKIKIDFAISDLKGISEEIEIEIANKKIKLIPSGKGISLYTNELSGEINSDIITPNQKIPFKLMVKIKGSQSINFAPIGKTTKVKINSKYQTPSFFGNILPTKRTVNKNGFSCEWNALYINRDYPQIMEKNYSFTEEINESIFGVELIMPVQHYQKTTRCVKYAMLFLILTFATFFFIEIIQKKNVHPIQYLLVGLALILFYSLLLSFSEHLGFGLAYLISSAMTIIMLTLYTIGILKIKKTAYYVGGILALLYGYIYILIQMETYALLAGSVGLFVILGIIMYFSQKINWRKGE